MRYQCGRVAQQWPEIHMAYSTAGLPKLLERATCGRQRRRVCAARGRYFIAALASLPATLTVLFAVLVALDTVFAAAPVADETVRDAVRVADLTAPLTIFSIGDLGGGRLMPCAFSNAFTASDNSFTRSERRSTSDEV